LTKEQQQTINDMSLRFRENKPSISENSIRTYTSLLRTVYTKQFSKTAVFDFDWFENTDTLLEIIKTKPTSTQLTILSALIGFTKNNQPYKIHLELITAEKIKIPTEIKSPVQETNWITFDEVKNVFEDLYTKYKGLLKTEPPKTLTNMEHNQVLDLLIMSLTCGYFIEPRRNLDWTQLKLTNISTETDNYIDIKNKKIYFNRYKTDWKYKEQIIDIPKKLAKILKRFMRLSGNNEYLLTKNNGSKFESPDITHSLNKVFKMNVSTSMLRHIYLTNKYQDAPLYSDMKKTAYNMGHSVGQGLEYVKI